MPTDRQRLAFVTGLNRLAWRWATGKVQTAHAARKLREAAEHLEGLDKPADGEQATMALEPPPDITPDARKVFDYWRERTHREKAQYTPGRRQKIAARLEHSTVDDLKRVIDWAAAADFMQGHNDRSTRYDTIETLFRSDEKVERYLEMAGPKQETLFLDDETADLKRRAARAMKDGDQIEYERCNEQLRAALANDGAG